VKYTISFLRLLPHLFVLILICTSLFSFSSPHWFAGSPPDTLKSDSIKLRYPFDDETTLSPKANKLYLKNPSNVKIDVEYDPLTHQYNYVYKIGNMTYRLPVTMSFDEYQDIDMQQMLQNYWKQRAEAASIDKFKGDDTEDLYSRESV